MVVGIGTWPLHLRDLAKSYKEAQIAIEVGKVFDTEKYVINYENLGIGRLIYQLPTTLCEMFLQEVFKKNPIDALDKETLFTIHKFFENNLNVSETARKLFVHRNTWCTGWRRSRSSRAGPAGVRRRHYLQGGSDGQEISDLPGHRLLSLDGSHKRPAGIPAGFFRARRRRTAGRKTESEDLKKAVALRRKTRYNEKSSYIMSTGGEPFGRARRV